MAHPRCAQPPARGRAAWLAVAAVAALLCSGGCSGSSGSAPAPVGSSVAGQPCSGGLAVQAACVTKGSDGSCAGSSFEVGSQVFQCASCADCTQASMAAEQACAAPLPHGRQFRSC